MARSWLLSLSCPERLRDRFRDRIRLVQPCIPLRDGPKNAHHVNILVILLVKVLQGGLPGQCQQGRPVYVCICYSRGKVCCTGSQRRGTDPRPTGQPSVDPGHERCSLLVTDGDDFDSLRQELGRRIQPSHSQDTLRASRTLSKNHPTLFRASVHGIFRAMIESVESQISRPCGLDSSQPGT